MGVNDFVINVQDGAMGGARSQDYHIPTRMECSSCHNSSLGFIRGLRTGQMNKVVDGFNQISAFADLQLFSNPEDIPVLDTDMPRYVAADDITASNEDVVKSYLAVNCSHCHNPDPAAPCNAAGDDFRFGSFNVQTLTTADPAAGRQQRIVPGNSAGSSVFDAMASQRMPQIGTQIVDPVFLPRLMD